MHRLIAIASCTLFLSGGWAQEAFHSLVVHTRSGQLYTYDITEVDSITFDTLQSVQRCKWYQTLENPGIADYLRDFDYDPSDYSYHRLFDYRGAPYLDERQDWPYGVTLGDSTYYNLIPGQTYTLDYCAQGIVRPSRVHTLGQLRMIRAESLRNIRDLGGWPTANGGSVRYGLLYRGPELDAASSGDLNLLHTFLGICADLDLRGSTETSGEVSPLGSDVVYANYSLNYTTPGDEANKALYVPCLRFLIRNLREGRPVYIHCVYGADRTGLLCMLLEGLMGMSQSDLDKDYEITSFCGNTRYRYNQYYQLALSMVLSCKGGTLQEQFRNFWLNVGATEAELDEFISLMVAQP